MSAPVGAVITPECVATPNGLASGFGSVWVANHPVGSLDRIDPATNKVTVIDLPKMLCMIAWVGAGRVWVGHCENGGPDTWVVAPATNKIAATVSAYAIQAAFVGPSIWLESNDLTNVLRFDTHTLRRTATIDVEGLPVTGGGFLWVIGQDNAAVVSIKRPRRYSCSDWCAAAARFRSTACVSSGRSLT